MTIHRYKAPDVPAEAEELPPPKLGVVSNLLPEDARCALISASQHPRQLDRTKAVYMATQAAKRKYPNLFKE